MADGKRTRKASSRKRKPAPKVPNMYVDTPLQTVVLHGGPGDGQPAVWDGVSPSIAWVERVSTWRDELHPDHHAHAERHIRIDLDAPVEVTHGYAPDADGVWRFVDG